MRPFADLEDAGCSFVIGGKLPEVPYVIGQWRRKHPNTEPAEGMVLTQPVIMGPKADQRRRATFYQYKADRARRTLHGIDQQVAKADKAVAGQAPIKRNRFVTLTGGTRTVNRDLETRARALAGWKPYITNLDAEPAWVIGAYHQLWRIEHAFRMSKHDLRARPVYHHKRESIDAHLAVVFAALAISHRIEALDRLDDQEVRPQPASPPHRQDQHRQPHPDRRRPATRRHPPCTHRDPRRRCALVWPKSGQKWRASHSIGGWYSTECLAAASTSSGVKSTTVRHAGASRLANGKGERGGTLVVRKVGDGEGVMLAEGEVEVLEPSPNTLGGSGNGFPSTTSALPSETLEALQRVRRFKQEPWHQAPFCGRRLTVSPRSRFAQGVTGSMSCPQQLSHRVGRPRRPGIHQSRSDPSGSG